MHFEPIRLLHWYSHFIILQANVHETTEDIEEDFCSIISESKSRAHHYINCANIKTFPKCSDK